MGSACEANCTACGYTKSVTIGGARSDFATRSFWPIFCEQCAAMTHANIAVSPLSCCDCGSQHVAEYGDNLCRGGRHSVQRWFDRELTDGDYLCPECRTYTLRFSASGILFD